MISSDINDSVKIGFTREMIVVPCAEEFEDIMEAFGAFIRLGAPEESSVGVQTVSYEEDAAYIIADFQKEYGIDLINVKHLHWWHFKMLFDGLPEGSNMKQRIYYRSIDLSSIENKNERKRIRKIKRAVALKNVEVTDGDIANAFI